MKKADANTDGYLSSSDWKSFNNSVPITRTITVNGDKQDLSTDVDFTVPVPVVTHAALTRTNDTNVTLTLGGTPATALLKNVSITAGWTGTLADDRITSATTWNNKVTSLTAGTGISIGGTATVPTVTNTAPDQTIALTPGTGIAVSGTYPNFTITNSAPSTTSGTVTSVSGTGTSAGLSLSGTVTTSGNLTLSGTLSTPVSTINDSTTVGQNIVKLVNPSAITFMRINADNTISTLDAAGFRTAIGAGTSSTTGTVTSVAFTDNSIFTCIITNPTTTPNLSLTLVLVDGGSW